MSARLVVSLVAAGWLGAVVHAEPPEGGPWSSPSERGCEEGWLGPGESWQGGRKDRKGGELEPFRKWDEKRGEKWERWQQLSEEERRMIRERGKAMRREAQERVLKRLEERGMKLEPERRREFLEAYWEERRRMERELREEFRRVRAQKESELFERLVRDFEAGLRGSPKPAVQQQEVEGP